MRIEWVWPSECVSFKYWFAYVWNFRSSAKQGYRLCGGRVLGFEVEGERQCRRKAPRSSRPGR